MPETSRRQKLRDEIRTLEKHVMGMKKEIEDTEDRIRMLNNHYNLINIEAEYPTKDIAIRYEIS